MSSVYLPEQTIVEILLRMPSKILILCKIVCKSWNARISDPAFLALHLVRTQNQHDRIVVLRGDPDTGKNVISLFSSENPYELQDLPYDTTLSKTEEGKYLRTGFTILCCNHLLFLQPFFTTKIILWNTKETEFKILPQCDIPLDPPNACRYTSEIGFGFDLETNDYKVIRMITYGYDQAIVQTELYSLRTGSWRKLEANPQIRFGIISLARIYINGMFYWYGFRSGVKGLWSFDMSTELFEFTPLPVQVQEHSIMFCTFLEFCVLNDRPAMILTFPRSRFDIWVLLEHGVRDSWTRLYSIPCKPEIRVPLGSWKSRELFTEGKDGQLLLYDPITHEIKNLNIRGNIYSFKILKYRDCEFEFSL